MTDNAPHEDCRKICVPYFAEIARLTITEEPKPDLLWVTIPDVHSTFPPQFQMRCPHQVTWMCHPTWPQVQKWEDQYPLQPEVFPSPFVCLVVDQEGAEGCTHEIEILPAEPLEVALKIMLDHITTEHGSPAYWLSMHHLCANYPGLSNYCGSNARIEAHENRLKNQ